MATAIRLTRRGGNKNPLYRVVVTDSRAARDGRFIETLGYYNPQTDPSTFEIDEEKVRSWLSRGARPSNTVRRLLDAQGIS